jgi:hypothetical protein
MELRMKSLTLTGTSLIMQKMVLSLILTQDSHRLKPGIRMMASLPRIFSEKIPRVFIKLWTPPILLVWFQITGLLKAPLPLMTKTQPNLMSPMETDQTTKNSMLTGTSVTTPKPQRSSITDPDSHGLKLGTIRTRHQRRTSSERMLRVSNRQT